MHGAFSYSTNVHAQTSELKYFCKKVVGTCWYWNRENVTKVSVLGPKNNFLIKIACIGNINASSMRKIYASWYAKYSTRKNSEPMRGSEFIDSYKKLQKKILLYTISHFLFITYS